MDHPPTQNPPQSSPAHAHRADRRLILLNAALGAGLLAVTLSAAQPGAPSNRPRGEYALVAGKAQGLNAHVVYILDGANRELAAVKWNRDGKQFEPLGYRNLVGDAQYFRPAR